MAKVGSETSASIHPSIRRRRGSKKLQQKQLQSTSNDNDEDRLSIVFVRRRKDPNQTMFYSWHKYVFIAITTKHLKCVFNFRLFLFRTVRSQNRKRMKRIEQVEFTFSILHSFIVFNRRCRRRRLIHVSRSSASTPYNCWLLNDQVVTNRATKMWVSVSHLNPSN